MALHLLYTFLRFNREALAVARKTRWMWKESLWKIVGGRKQWGLHLWWELDHNSQRAKGRSFHLPVMTNMFNPRVHEKTGQSTREDRVPIMRLESQGGDSHSTILWSASTPTWMGSRWSQLLVKPLNSQLGQRQQPVFWSSTGFVLSTLCSLQTEVSYQKPVWIFKSSARCVGVYNVKGYISTLCFCWWETWCPARLGVFPRVLFTSTSVHCLIEGHFSIQSQLLMPTVQKNI